MNADLNSSEPNGCNICGKIFKTKSNVARHKKNVHAPDKPVVEAVIKNYPCRVCESTYTTIANRRRHEKEKHEYHPECSQNLNCSECLQTFHKTREILDHYDECHPDLTIKTEKVVFQTEEDFLSWKISIEKETSSSYVSKATHRTLKSSVHVFKCHRSGVFVSEGSGQRHLKVSGSNKIGFFCPAGLKAVSLDTGVIEVIYTSTHIGHSCDVGRLGLSKTEKNEIAGLMHAGVPASAVLNKIASTASPTKRFAATNSQDLRNIAVSYGIDINCVRSSNDVISVDSWVKEMQSKDCNPILLYKLSGETSELFPDTGEEDFLLGFMNEAQEEILKLYGGEVICVDSTHGTNKYDIQLTSVLVKDDNWEGFPVAFLWSNRQSESIFNYFFNSLKERVGNFSTQTFMSDDYPAYYNAWINVFGVPKFHLICDWHVKRAWRKNLSAGPSKVQDPEKRNIIISQLDSLANELDEFTFKELLNIRLSQWMEDTNTSSFAAYFSVYYKNRPEQWAACYRINSNINTNMTVERWHKDLKYNSDLNGKCGGRLDKAIHSLMKSLQVKIMNRLSSIQRGKLTKRVTDIRKKHQLAVDKLNEISVYEKNENEWIVPSFNTLGEIYVVKKLDLDPHHVCKINCDYCKICIHQFRCSCPDSAIKYNLCKHIHIASLKNTILPETQGCENDELSIDLGACEPSEQEKLALVKEIRQNQNAAKSLENLKQDAISAILGLIPEVEKFTSEDQCKEMLKGIAVLKSKCSSLATFQHNLPPIVSNNAPIKKIDPQRKFPAKKKRKTDNSDNKNQYNDNLQVILVSKDNIQQPNTDKF